MTGWDWLTKPAQPYNGRFIFRVLIKTVVLFILFNLIFAWLDPLPSLGSISIYNGITSGRERLPYGEDDRAYNLSLNSLDAMFAAHTLSRPRAPDEYRVLLIGDSATWGILLRPEETLAGILSASDYTTQDGRDVRVYNLGHPIMSLTKDLLLLDYALRYEPDMIIWLTTLQSFPRDKQLFPPIVHNNADRVRHLITAYDLDLDPQDGRFVEPSFLDKTIVGRRREIADWLRLQLFGVMWSLTGIDQFYPDTYDLRSEDFEENITWQNFTEPKNFTADDLAFDVVRAGIEIAGDVPILLVNEPTFISAGSNSDLRYNFWYPRWAYDSYRELYARQAEANGWHYLDLWDIIDPAEFTDSPVHLTPAGSQQLGEIVGAALMALANGDPLPEGDEEGG